MDKSGTAITLTMIYPGEAAESHKIILDLARLSEASPSFVRFIIRLHRDAKEADCSLHLIGVTHRLERSLETLGLTRLFTYETEE